MPAAIPRVVLLSLAALGLGGCLNHFVVHPKTPAGGVETRSEETVVDGLRIRLEWALPASAPGSSVGALPAVIVHPEANHTAREMRGVLYALAAEGYLAVAADYQRRGPGGGLFAWQGRDDVRRVYEQVRADPRVDPERIAALGYSQGGVYGLLIAAETRGLAAVIAYYPVTDFAAWLRETDRPVPQRWVFGLIARWMRRASGATSDEELDEILARASPITRVDRITCPVLLIHGDRDRSAPIDQSRRLAERLRAQGTPVELVVFEDAGHVFNFRDPERARRAWNETMAWLERWVPAAPRHAVAFAP